MRLPAMQSQVRFTRRQSVTAMASSGHGRDSTIASACCVHLRHSRRWDLRVSSESLPNLPATLGSHARRSSKPSCKLRLMAVFLAPSMRSPSRVRLFPHNMPSANLTPTPSALRQAVIAQKGDVAALLEVLRAGSSIGEGVTRDTYGSGEQFAHGLIAQRAAVMGLEIHRDHAANLLMTLIGNNRDAPRLMTGSHLDSVANGGNFDGAAGVIAGLVA